MCPSEIAEAETPTQAEQKLRLFLHGALLQRITDTGAIIVEQATGWNTANDEHAAQAMFRAAVQKEFPAFGILRATIQEVPVGVNSEQVTVQ